MDKFWSLVVCCLFVIILHAACGCSLMPVHEGGRLVHTTGVDTIPSSSVGHCISQCYIREQCNGANYLKWRKVCEMLTPPVEQGEMEIHNGSIHITMIRGIAEGSVRVVDGSSEHDGRVEIYLNDTWGTLCDQDWDDIDAGVVCHQLGFCTGRSRLGESYPRGKLSTKHRHAVACNGSEDKLMKCPALEGPGSCKPEDNAGAFCTECNVRLIGGNAANKGRLEVFLNGSLGTVCDDGWDDTDATVVCKELGFCSGVGRSAAEFGQGTGPIHLDNVGCQGHEKSVLDCPSIGQDQHNCKHDEDVGVECQFEFPCLRLVNGSSPMNGRVELFDANSWGTICDDKWTDVNAAVVCRQQGFCGGKAMGLAYFGIGVGEVFMDDVHCTGTELNIMTCPRSASIHNCGHTEDAGVICQPCKT